MEDPPVPLDDLGPGLVVHVHEPSVGLRGVLVVDNVAAGPSIGGVRMAPDVSAGECARLARAMTLKNAAAGLAHGGGKSVIYGDPAMPRERKEAIIRAFARAIRGIDSYIPGPDMGTDETCMAWTFDEIGRAVGLPPEIGGIPLDEIGATGFGVMHAAEVAVERCDFGLDGARVVVQGFGSVGKHAARFLGEKGARLVGASDSRGAVQDPAGLDVAALIELKEAGKSVVDLPGATALDREAVIDVECDLWIPAARPDVVNEGNVDRLRTRLIVSGANIPITAGAEATLHERGVVHVPDFIANAGGVICAAVEYHGGTRSQAFATIEEKIRENTRVVLEDSARRSVGERQAAVDLATGRVRAAMALRRFPVI